MDHEFREHVLSKPTFHLSMWSYWGVLWWVSYKYNVGTDILLPVKLEYISVYLFSWSDCETTIYYWWIRFKSSQNFFNQYKDAQRLINGGHIITVISWQQVRQKKNHTNFMGNRLLYSLMDHSTHTILRSKRVGYMANSHRFSASAGTFTLLLNV